MSQFNSQSKKIKRSYSAVALVMVQVALVLLAVIVTDMSVSETVRYKLATFDRDSLKAEALAKSGLEAARLVVAVQAKLQPLLNQIVGGLGIPLPEYTIWRLIPMDSEILKGLIDGSIQQSFGRTLDESEENLDPELPDDQEPSSVKEKKEALPIKYTYLLIDLLSVTMRFLVSLENKFLK